jgi:hypothetical protein
MLCGGLQTTYPPGDQADIGASVILLSGCQDNQTSADGDENGLFTEVLLKVWNDGNFKDNFMPFWRDISAQMPWYQSLNCFRVGTPNMEFESQRPFTI